MGIVNGRLGHVVRLVFVVKKAVVLFGGNVGDVAESENIESDVESAFTGMAKEGFRTIRIN